MSFLKNVIGFLNGFRKLTICIIVILVASVFLITGHMDGAQFTSIITVTIPSYYAGNVGEHATDAFKTWLNEKLKK